MMNKSQKMLNLTDEQESSLNRLASTIEDFHGEFMLIFAHCNYMGLRERLVQHLQEFCLVETVVIQPSDITLYTTIQTQITEKKPLAVMVLGLETVTNLQQMLASADQVREEFQKNFHFPLILWVNDRVQVQLMESAPNFENWGITKELTITNEQLAVVLKDKSGDFFTYNSPQLTHGEALALEVEIEAAQRDFRSSENLELEVYLQSLLGFVKININHKRDSALKHYKKALELWQQLGDLEKQGTILGEIAFCYYLQAFKQPLEHPDWQKTRDYLEQALQAWEDAKRPDLMADSITKLGRIFRKLEDWEKLKQFAEKALEWHRKDMRISGRIEDYSFLAEVALVQEQWDKAINLAEESLKIYQIKSENQEVFDPIFSRCNLIKARAEQHLGEYQEAIKFLEFVEQYGIDFSDIQLYLDILHDLHQFYFENQQYGKAFEIKQRSQRNKYKYGLKAFIGASHLTTKEISAFMTGNSSQNLPREIISSGRDQDVKNLVKWVKRDDKKVIVIHGTSGVGKSSLINAGLVPSLEQDFIGLENFIPVYIRSYNKWQEELGKKLKKALEKNNIKLTNPLKSSEFILEEVQNSQYQNLRFVLIFDQFEEFFFIADTEELRTELFEFLGKCLDITTLKVIFSLRPDYIHLLLNRPGMKTISDDILSTNVLYKISNFSVDTAKSLIDKLTQQSSLRLEKDLIEEFVNDLVEKDGQIRPIELQVVGAQLEQENITTLGKYRQSGPKEKLIKQYLAEAIRDCGLENKRFTKLVLYLLTDENKNRPLKTHAELEADLKALTVDLAIDAQEIKLEPEKLSLVLEQKIKVEPEKLSLVLDILVRSGLLLKLPEANAFRYQLVHDYLVSFIRENGSDLCQEIKNEYFSEKFEKKVSLAQKHGKEQQKRFIIVGFLLCVVTVVVGFYWYRAEEQGIKAISKHSEYLFASGQRFESLKEALRAGRKFKQLKLQNQELREEVITTLQQSLNWQVEQNRFEGHDAIVWDLSISPDGKTIASASYDNTARLWNPDGSLIQELNEHDHRVLCVNFSPDGKMLATASFDNTVKLWKRDGNDWVVDKTLKGHTKGVYYVSFSPDGKTIATASRDKTVKLWKLEGQLSQTLKGHKDGVNGVSFSPDGKTIATASRDKTVKLWKRDGNNSWSEYKSLKGHEDIIWGVSFSPNVDSPIIASASRDNTVKIWNLEGKLIETLKGHKEAVFRVSFSKKGNLMASVSQDKSVRLWNVVNQEFTLKTILTGHGDRVYDAAFLDEHTLLSASSDHTIKFWKINNQSQISLYDVHKETVRAVSFSPDGQMVASASDDGTVKLWNLQGELIHTIEAYDSENDESKGHESKVIDVSFYLWNLQRDWKLPRELIDTILQGELIDSLKAYDNEKDDSKGHKSKVIDVSFSPDGKQIATASEDKTVKLWNLQGEAKKTLVYEKTIKHKDQVFGVSFSPDGKTIATASRDNIARLWTREGKLVKELKGHIDWVWEVSFSKDGKLIATASDDHTVKLWKPDGTLLKTLGGKDGHKSWVYSVSFSPDGKRIATASNDRTVKIWEADGTLFKTIKAPTDKGHTDQVRSVSFSPDGKLIATASDDRTVKLWKTDGTLSKNLPGHRHELWDVSFSPNSKTLAVAGADDSLILWNLDSLEDSDNLDKLLEKGCQWLGSYLKHKKNKNQENEINKNLDKSDRKLCDGIGSGN